MPLKETNDEIIFVEVLKKSTIDDLMKFKDNSSVLARFGIKGDGIDKLADALTKLISDSIKSSLLGYLEDLVESKEIEPTQVEIKEKKGGKNGKKVKNS